MLRPMVDTANRIGSGASLPSNRTSDRSAARAAASGTRGGPRPNGPRGLRMLSPDTPLDQLDRSAPRGTYLDILV